jgi:hypothetical protein
LQNDYWLVGIERADLTQDRDKFHVEDIQIQRYDIRGMCSERVPGPFDHSQRQS